MAPSLAFLNELSLRLILNMFVSGLFHTRELLQAASDQISRKIVNDVEKFDDWSREKYSQLMTQLRLLNGPPNPATIAKPADPEANTSSTLQSPGVATGEPVGVAMHPGGSGGTDSLTHLTILSESDVVVKRFGLTSRRLRFSFKNPVEGNPLKWLKNAITEPLEHVCRNFSQGDTVGIVLENDEFADKPVYISFRRLDQLNADIVMARISDILQSNATFFTNDLLNIRADVVKIPVGRGYSVVSGKCVNFDEFCASKFSIFTVENLDNLCLAYALVVALEFVKACYDRSLIKRKFSGSAGKDLLREIWKIVAKKGCNRTWNT